MAAPRKKEDPAPEHAASEQAGKARGYVKQTDVPGQPIEQALRIPRVISDQFGKHPATPLDIATALQMTPSSGPFRAIAGAALAYGFTDAGPKADMIGLADLGLRAVAPTEEGDDLAAQREGFLRPRVVREFLERYDGSKVPNEQIGRNVLERMGVPARATERVFHLIVEGADRLGLLNDIKGDKYVNLRGSHLRVLPSPLPEDVRHEDRLVDAHEPVDEIEEEPDVILGAAPKPDDVPPFGAPTQNRRVFITHGGNRKMVARVKEMLSYGDFEPVVSVEREATAKPVPEKVIAEMRSCGAGIIHVGTEKTIVDKEGNEHHLLNDNVLVEIGIAMAAYGTNFILLVEEGTKLPSNLQGLYEVRYQGDDLDADATMRLLRAFREFKN